MCFWSSGLNRTACVQKAERCVGATQVGLMIDLTNTWRYYERDEIDELAVEHLKVCPPNASACLRAHKFAGQILDGDILKISDYNFSRESLLLCRFPAEVAAR